MDLTPAGRGARRLGLPHVRIPFHSSLSLAGQGPLSLVTSRQHDNSPCGGERRARVLHRRPEKDQMVSFFPYASHGSASSISDFLPSFGEGYVCLFHFFCIPYIWALQTGCDDPFCDLPSSFEDLERTHLPLRVREAALSLAAIGENEALYYTMPE